MRSQPWIFTYECIFFITGLRLLMKNATTNDWHLFRYHCIALKRHLRNNESVCKFFYSPNVILMLWVKIHNLVNINILKITYIHEECSCSLTIVLLIIILTLTKLKQMLLRHKQERLLSNNGSVVCKGFLITKCNCNCST